MASTSRRGRVIGFVLLSALSAAYAGIYGLILYEGWPEFGARVDDWLLAWMFVAVSIQAPASLGIAAGRRWGLQAVRVAAWLLAAALAFLLADAAAELLIPERRNYWAQDLPSAAVGVLLTFVMMTVPYALPAMIAPFVLRRLGSAAGNHARRHPSSL